MNDILKPITEWSNWESGYCICEKEGTERITASSILSKIVSSFRRIVIDWEEGERWVRTRIAKLIELNSPDLILYSEKLMLKTTALVSLTDDEIHRANWVRFYLTIEHETIDLHFKYLTDCNPCIYTSQKLAELIGYDFLPSENFEMTSSNDSTTH